ncbi:hypothetical protein M8J76_004484 [Diaphorina citri]|nr:hypothetical protein M8J76_004484 [Diaphorina citri]
MTALPNFDLRSQVPLSRYQVTKMFEQEIQRLNAYSFRLNQLFYAPSKADKMVLNALLDDFNSLQYKFYFLQNQKPDKVILIINQLCTLISTQDHFLVAKHCQLIHQIISTQHIALTDATLKLTLQWCIQALSDCPSISTVDILLALNTLITCHVTSQVVNSVSSVLFDTLIDPTEDNISVNTNDVFLFRMKCLNSLIPHLSTPKLDLLGGQILNYLCSLHPCSHFLLITLRSVCQYHTDEWITSHLGSLISTVLSYAKYDLPGYVFVKPKPIFPSPGFQLDISIEASSNSNGPKAVSSFKTRAKNKKKNKDKEEVEIVIVTPSPCNTQSDSDYSDSEISRLKKINASIRLTCFKLLSTILDKVNKKQIFGFISTLTMGNESLPSCLLVESSAKCRVAILSALIQIFTYSKPFLALAQFEGKTERAFVSFATLLTDVILCVHDKVLQCLQREQYASVIIHLLKCVDTLAINSPYEKLRTNLCEKLTDAVFPFVSHRDANITVVALTCFSDMVVLCSEDVLVRLCHLVFAKLQSEDSLVPVLVECWQLLSVVAKLKINLVLNYPDLWSILVKLMDHHLTWAKGSNLVQLHTVIAMQHFCQNLHSSDTGRDECNQLWLQIMEKKYFISLQDKAESPALLTAICDCLATMNHMTYDILDRAHQRTCLAILFGHCSHDESTVRAAAVRALAIYSAFEHEDPVFLADVADMLVKCAHDPVPLVRGKAAWSLGNLSDTLVSHQESGTDIDLFSLLTACLHCCEDSEKIRSNAVRPLGIFLKLLTAAHVTEETYRVAVGQSVVLLTRLAGSGTNMKIKWNACYALGHVLSNPHLTRLPDSQYWKDCIFPTMCNLLTSCNNFKVRISVCTTLSALDSREQYNPHFHDIVNSVLCSFAVTTHTYDIHLSSLKVTLYKTLCHFVLLLNPVDIASQVLLSALGCHGDAVKAMVMDEELGKLRERCRGKVAELSRVCEDSKCLDLLRVVFMYHEITGALSKQTADSLLADDTKHNSANFTH